MLKLSWYSSNTFNYCIFKISISYFFNNYELIKKITKLNY